MDLKIIIMQVMVHVWNRIPAHVFSMPRVRL
jgi:hypothetical protein